MNDQIDQMAKLFSAAHQARWVVEYYKSAIESGRMTGGDQMLHAAVDELLKRLEKAGIVWE